MSRGRRPNGLLTSLRSMAVLSSRAKAAKAAKFARKARENERRSREKKLLPPQSPRGFYALARLYYLARPTKTAMHKYRELKKFS